MSYSWSASVNMGGGGGVEGENEAARSLLLQNEKRNKTSRKNRSGQSVGGESEGGFSEETFFSPNSTNSSVAAARSVVGGLRHYGSNFQFAIFSMVIVAGVLVLLPLMLLHALDDLKNHRPEFAAFYSAGMVVAITVILSMRQIYAHLTHWYMPDVQKYVVRIVWMVPLYAVQSWISLRFPSVHIIIDALRDLYEAFVIQSFVYYLIELLGGEETLILTLQNKDEHYGHHDCFTSRFVHQWQMGTEFMLKCKHGVLQYVVVKTFVTVTTIFLQPMGLYGEGTYDWNKAYVYISIIINISQMWALYCLIKFFHATSHDLRHPKNWRPIGKFLCVKGVVFFTWWQGCLIALLQNRGIISTADNVAGIIQDYIICIEMFFFALAHAVTFTYREYLPPTAPKPDNPFFLFLRAWSNPLLGSPSNNNNNGNHAAGNNNNNHNLSNAATSNNLFSSSNNNIEEESPDYHPPTIRTLHAPMGIRDALWSSTLPTEAISDIKRLGTGVSDEVMTLSNDPGMISMASMQYAESI